jgi:hypothetical protein
MRNRSVDRAQHAFPVSNHMIHVRFKFIFRAHFLVAKDADYS